MQLIQCPWCGPREETEFSYGGEAHVAYPENPAELDDLSWAYYVFFRGNTKGVFAERWVHSAGCRRWFNALRDTVSYRFLAVYPMGHAAPLASAADDVPPDARDLLTTELESTDAR
ncbi:sarcosine oxidase subunit delta [Microbacterium sp. B2969]|uniref:Sarcosine oxidase subunit delta n=1 Tax=Microbacterium alkaliflavum TaxID=3248839 RepID=A0ABW7QGU7_9MICO